ncbi:sporulation protein YpjB [Paenibacillus koleovorans]|uniref:sporulation protein YpjB n=1 Tax=Paenibacillus koleovorans TaxID=121608 RepID=UPI000FD6BA2E|nr:sporulation protein YpjB [Paenibacillus koleovorans]
MFVSTKLIRLRSVLAAMALLGIAVWTSGCGHAAEQTAGAVASETLKQVEQLDAAADLMYKKVIEGDIDTARVKLSEVGDKLTQIRFTGIATVEGIQALTDSVIDAKRELNATSFSAFEGQLAAAKVRLATDALSHRNQPMWLQYYKGMKENVKQLEDSARAGRVEPARTALASLSKHYAVIRPAVILNREVHEVERLESLFSFLNTQVNAERWDMKQLGSGIEHMSAMIDQLFHRKDAEAFLPLLDQPNPTLWVAGLGTIIIAVLAFAAWRIFRVEQGIVGKPKDRAQDRTRGRFF